MGARRRHYPRLRHRRLRRAGRGAPPRIDRAAGDCRPRRRHARHSLARGRARDHDRARDARLRRQLRCRVTLRIEPMSPADNIAIITFGCRLNAFESDVIRRLAGEAGLRDTIIVNTCAVTAEAERQARQAIRRARREQPHARIIVTGCAATLDPARYAALAEVDLVLDNDAKLRLESYAIAPHPHPLPPRGGGGAPAAAQTPAPP